MRTRSLSGASGMPREYRCEIIKRKTWHCSSQRMPVIKCHTALRGERHKNYMNTNSTIYKAIIIHNEITNRFNRKKKKNPENIRLAGGHSMFYMLCIQEQDDNISCYSQMYAETLRVTVQKMMQMTLWYDQTVASWTGSSCVLSENVGLNTICHYVHLKLFLVLRVTLTIK